MKNYSYANRGMPFEEYIKYANLRYMREGKAVVVKVPTEFKPIRNAYGQVVNCKVEEKSPVDFMGRYRNIPVAIEAKHTSKDRINFSEVQDHQAEFLDSFVGEYGLGLGFGAVLVSFKLERFFLVPWLYWKAGRDMWNNRNKNKNCKDNRATIAGYYNTSWTTPGKASVSADELNPAWEVKRDNRYGLAYLSKIDTYIGN